MHCIEIVDIVYLSKDTEMVYFPLWRFVPMAHLFHKKKNPNHKIHIYLC